MGRLTLIDTNLAVLLVVGETSRKYISGHKRLRAYEARDFDLLRETLGRYDGILFTPNVLTETSNLVRQSAEPRRSEFLKTFSEIVRQFEERYVPSASVVMQSAFLQLGLADSALLASASERNILVTADFDAYYIALASGLDAINFNHLRAETFGA